MTFKFLIYLIYLGRTGGLYTFNIIGPLHFNHIFISTATLYPHRVCPSIISTITCNIRKLAAKLCSLGGSTFISDGVLRFQASDDAHLDQLVEEALNFGQQGMLYPPRQDLKRARIVTPAALNSELESDEKLYLLTSPSLLQEKQWRRAAESMQLSPVGTVAQAHSVLVKGPASAQVRRKEFKWATIYMRNHEDVLKEVGTEGEPLAAKASLATSISPATSSSSSSPSPSSSFPTPSSSPSSFTSTSPIITHPTPEHSLSQKK